MREMERRLRWDSEESRSPRRYGCGCGYGYGGNRNGGCGRSGIGRGYERVFRVVGPGRLSRKEALPEPLYACVGLTGSYLCWRWVHMRLHLSMRFDAAAASGVDEYTRRRSAALIRT